MHVFLLIVAVFFCVLLLFVVGGRMRLERELIRVFVVVFVFMLYNYYYLFLFFFLRLLFLSF